jgi:hypothetical protein
MKPALLDVNVLLALAWPTHVHHALAHRWFHEHARHGWVTCPITQSGFVRISSNAKIIDGAESPQAALALLRQMLRLEHHHFWADDLNLATAANGPFARVGGYRQMTDAYLLALAAAKGGRLVTLDRGVSTLVPQDWRVADVLTVIQ